MTFVVVETAWTRTGHRRAGLHLPDEHHPPHLMADATADGLAQPRTRSCCRTATDGVASITLNRPEAGNAITAAMRDQIVVWLEEASADLVVRAVVLTGAGEKGFCTGADLRSQEAGPARPDGRPPAGRGRCRPADPHRVAAPDQCGARLREAGHRRRQRHRGRWRHAPGPGLRPGGGGRGGQVHRGLRPPGHRPRRRRRLPAAPSHRSAEGQGALLLRRRRPGAGGRAPGAGQPGGPAGASSWPRSGAWAARLAAGPTKAIGVAKYLTNRSLESDRAAALWDEVGGPGAGHRAPRTAARAWSPSPSAARPCSRAGRPPASADAARRSRSRTGSRRRWPGW